MMRTITDLVHCDAISPTLAVLLPGAYDTPEDFQRHGFIAAVRERALAVDMVLADMNLQCITGGTALPSLQTTIIEPARAAGYPNIILVGISIGGFMAAMHADRYPGAVNGLCMIAPYLGNRIITGEIAAAGGILGWSPGGLAADDHERRAWRWLKSSTAGATTVHLGYGSGDRFAAAHGMLAGVLPPERVQVVPGGHDWPTWRAIWDRCLDRGFLTRRTQDGCRNP
jgi:pimeloyl-ACP methyl ester carboxylesterase